MPRAPGHSAPQPVPPTPGFIQLGLFEPTASGQDCGAVAEREGMWIYGVVVVFVAVLTGGLVPSLLLDWP